MRYVESYSSRSRVRGAYVPVGGSESRETLGSLVRELCPMGSVAVCTAATMLKEEAVDKYGGIFESLGCSVTFPSDEEFVQDLQSLKKVDMLFFTGGDQSRIVEAFSGTGFACRVAHLQSQGLVVCGTSAGAAVMSGNMICGGTDVPKLSRGLSFLDGIIVDSHFEERNRLPRLSAAVGVCGGLGLGLAEDCAVVVRGNVFRVVGSGNATVVTKDGVRVLVPGESLFF